MSLTFVSLPVSEEQSVRMNNVRDHFTLLEQYLLGQNSPQEGAVIPLLKGGREASIVKTKLEEACAWAIKGITRE